MARQFRRGVTLTDVVVVVVMLCMLGTALMQTAGRARESANRIKCMNNVKQIGSALLLYANENKGQYPRTIYDPTAFVTATYDSGNGTAPVSPFQGAPAAKVNDVAMAMFLLARTQDITAEVFVCPSSDSERDTFTANSNIAGTAWNKHSFSAPLNLGYSLANPYPNKAAADAGYKWDNNLPADFAVAADLNPGGSQLTALTVNSSYKEMQLGNSANHQGQGQNVLYGDGHVEWQQNPFCGVNMDNIYTVSSGNVRGGTSPVIIGSPTWAGDSVMLPVGRLGTITVRSKPLSPTTFAIGAGIVALLVVGGLLAYQWRKERKAARGGG